MNYHVSTLVNSTLTEEVILHLFHKSGPVNQVNAGKSIPHERNDAERTAEFLTAYTDHLRLIRSAHPFQTIIYFIERNDLLADFLAQFRPIVLHCFKLFADTFAVSILTLALHEFVPRTEEKKAELAKELGVTVEEIEKRGESLHEVNPMMGHRGVRLHVSFPLIAEVEYRAIFTATAELQAEGFNPIPEIMIPVTISARELSFQKAICDRVKAEVEGKYSTTIHYQFGTMIEIPRAALTGDRMARTAQFFSFGTNDLTQMTFGFSRDDVGTFMGEYLGNKLLDADPFKTIDTKGVGKLVEYGIQSGRSKRPELKCGVCGEHGGDPDSIKFFNKIGIDYVSCSPFRVPIARLAAAQAAIAQSK